MLIIAYIPCSSEAEAKRIAETLVRGKLIACANIIRSWSVYEWNEKLEKTGEWIILAKTLPEIFEKLKKRVEELHSYKPPCILAIPVTDVNEEYLEWVKDQVKWTRPGS
jgi:periplasmic divalent cation tolerance protein